MFLCRIIPDGGKYGILCCKKHRKKIGAEAHRSAGKHDGVSESHHGHYHQQPLGLCGLYLKRATVDGCLKGTERYAGKVVYENALAKTVGQISVTVNTSAGYH